MKRIRVSYRKARVQVWCDKPDRCEACGREGRVECHHWKYAYKTSRVRANSGLALENTNWYCFRCHMVADALRKLLENMPIVLRLKPAVKRFSIIMFAQVAQIGAWLTEATRHKAICIKTNRPYENDYEHLQIHDFDEKETGRCEAFAEKEKP